MERRYLPLQDYSALGVVWDLLHEALVGFLFFRASSLALQDIVLADLFVVIFNRSPPFLLLTFL